MNMLALKREATTSALGRLDITNIAFCYFLALNLITTVWYRLLSETSRTPTYVVYGILALLIAMNAPKIIKRIKVYDVVFFLIFFSVYFFSMVFSVDGQAVHLEVLETVITKCFAIYIIARCVTDFHSLLKYLYVTVYILLAVITFALLGVGLLLTSIGMYSQSFGYAVLPIPIILIGCIFNKFRPYDVAALIYSTILVLSSGARGPVMCILATGVIMVALHIKKIDLKYIGIVLGAGIAGLLIYFNFYQIINFILNIFTRFGVSVRSVNKILENSFFMDNARANIADYAWEYILGHPVLGCGIINERAIIAENVFFSNDYIGCYPHNFFLEILMQFGLAIGLCILMAFAVFLKKCVFIKDKSAKICFICLIGIGFIPLMVSGSYVSAQSFYMFMGIGVAILQTQSEKRQESTITAPVIDSEAIKENV